MAQTLTLKPRPVFHGERTRLSDSFLLQVLKEMIRERVERAPWNHQVTIEVRDLEAWGIYSRAAKTWFGLLLNRLVKAGFMWVAKRSRPKHYVAKETLIRWALICTYPICRTNCGLFQVCPFWRLNLVEGVVLDDD